MTTPTLGARAKLVLIAAWPSWLVPALLVSFPSSLGAAPDAADSAASSQLTLAPAPTIAITLAVVVVLLLVHCAAKGTLVQLLADAPAEDRPSLGAAAARGLRATMPLLSILAVLLVPFVLAAAALGARTELVAGRGPLGQFSANVPNFWAIPVLAVGLLQVSIVDPAATRFAVLERRGIWSALRESFRLLKNDPNSVGRAWVTSAGLWIIWGLLATATVAAVRAVTRLAPGATFLGIQFPLDYLVGYCAFVYARAMTAALWCNTFAEQTADRTADSPAGWSPSDGREEPPYA